MSAISDLIKALPWEKLSEKVIIILASIILFSVIIFFYLKYKEKRIIIGKAKIEAAITGIKECNKTKQKEIDKFDNKIEIDLKRDLEIEEVIMGNIEGDGNANVKIVVQDGSKIKKSRIGNING